MKIYQIMSVSRFYFGNEYKLKAAYLDRKQAKTACAQLNKKAVRNEYRILTLNVIEPKE